MSKAEDTPPTPHSEVARHAGAWPPPPPLTLIDQPLDFIQAEHLRNRTYCVALATLSQRRQISRADADRMIAYLTADLALHYADEDEDLFPTLRRRALPEDDLGAVLARLGEDHRRQIALAEEIAADLSRNPAQEIVRLDTPAIEAMQAYVASENRHLAIENAVVLTIASVRLNRNDLRSLSRSMKARRGVGG